jgi:hypothetical protein
MKGPGRTTTGAKWSNVLQGVMQHLAGLFRPKESAGVKRACGRGDRAARRNEKPQPHERPGLMFGPPRGLPSPPHQQRPTHYGCEDNAGSSERVQADHIQRDTEFIVRDASGKHCRHRRGCQRYD